jgi:aerobic-type carbon monoxide dehydrogenase small subunit (CoxS/CutS family)
MDSYRIEVNGQTETVEAVAKTPLLWVLRDTLGLTGTKYSCGIGQCGTCTVHLDGEPVRGCATPIDEAEGHRITTIEGLSSDGTHPLQLAWLDWQVPQCGYCQPGQIMVAAALLKKNPQPSRLQLTQAMAGVLCRCGTYQRILRAVESAVESGGGE